MSEELKDFLSFCRTEKLNYIKKYNQKITLVRLDVGKNKSNVIAKDLNYEQYHAFEKIYILTYSKPLNPIDYGIAVQYSFQ